jgi:hypothetical protein
MWEIPDFDHLKMIQLTTTDVVKFQHPQAEAQPTQNRD